MSVDSKLGSRPTPKSNAGPPRVLLFFAIGFGLSLLMGGLKAIAFWLTDTYLYDTPWLGGFLKSIEIAEISNLLVFAVLGAGVGAATLLVPDHWTHWLKMAILVALGPFVFCASYLMQQHLWIQKVAKRADVPYAEAKTITNDFLKKETGSGGFLGFYPLSTQISELPTLWANLEAGTAANSSDVLTEELSSYNDPIADAAAYVFERVGWVVRFMYMTIAVLTALIYYFKGHDWAENRRYGSAEMPVAQPQPPAKQ
ncbi:MAG: hypothetical protein DCF25_04525 [Leptolyngbya foveolarum]|uniref:Uncharacterized protein n=1 Tax=Leptolyngbya foveolarum TaxID=47253 RepID=A0A2W4UNU8_9CYAN|nr:MAG: hypothetical protein DCF25_04525 [Leptolyngbya foveolarum]